MLNEFDQDTIAAISTPLGEGGLGVVRLSGKDAVVIADKIFVSRKGASVRDQKSFTAQYGHIVSNGETGGPKIIDEALLLLMRGPKSYTCEDVVEISAHGGPAVLQAILELVVKAGARLAGKGEFTKRAFLNGRIDLLQAEAVLDLVKAKTELGRQWASAQLEGVFSKKIQGFKNELLDVLSHLEASIDFPDDFPETRSVAEIGARLEKVAASLNELLASAQAGMTIKSGLKLVISGRPNVGKSSLMNQLAKYNRVIVTPFPGTTRDVVEEEIEIGGFPVRVSDTAGIQDTEHPIEKEGIERSKRAAAEGDLVLYVVDGSQEWSPEDQELLSGLQGRRALLVINKTDLPQRLDRSRMKEHLNGTCLVETSCVREGGTTTLERKLINLITQGNISSSDETVVSTVRQRDLLEKTAKNLEDAEKACLAGISPEFVALDVRLALDHLGMLVGEVVTDDLLEVLFNQFCIGK